MANRIRSREVVTVIDEIVYTRAVHPKKLGPLVYDAGLQEILLSEGEPAVRDIGHRYFQGFVRVRK